MDLYPLWIDQPQAGAGQPDEEHGPLPVLQDGSPGSDFGPSGALGSETCWLIE
jgi:hypothetical protein